VYFHSLLQSVSFVDFHRETALHRQGDHSYCACHSEAGAEVMPVPDMLALEGGSTQMTVRPELSEGQAKMKLQCKIIRYPQGPNPVAAESDPKKVSENS
jgi:hypothetical protein